MGENVLSKLAAEVKKITRIASDITDEIGKQVTGIDKKKILESVKDKLKGFDKADDIDQDAIVKSVKAEFKDSTPAPVNKTTAEKKSWNQRRKEKKKTKS